MLKQLEQLGWGNCCCREWGKMFCAWKKKGSGQKYLFVAFGVGSGLRLPILALVRGFLLFSVLWRSIFFFPCCFPSFWFFVHLEMVLCQICEWWRLHFSLCWKNSGSLFKENSPFLSNVPSQKPSLVLRYGFGTQGLTKHAVPSSLSAMGSSSAFGTVHVTVFICALVLALSPGLQMTPDLFPGKGLVDILPTSLFRLNASEILQNREISPILCPFRLELSIANLISYPWLIPPIHYHLLLISVSWKEEFLTICCLEYDCYVMPWSNTRILMSVPFLALTLHEFWGRSCRSYDAADSCGMSGYRILAVKWLTWEVAEEGSWSLRQGPYPFLTLSNKGGSEFKHAEVQQALRMRMWSDLQLSLFFPPFFCSTSSSSHIVSLPERKVLVMILEHTVGGLGKQCLFAPKSDRDAGK